MRSEGVMASALRLVVGFIMGGFLMGKVTTVQFYSPDCEGMDGQTDTQT